MNPTARALQTLDLVQSNPGITADRLAAKLDVSERAARRYVGFLREAGIPIESSRGPYGGYRIGRGLRLPPLMFTAGEALGLVMAVLDGHHDAAEGPAGAALGKIMRALPEPVAAQAAAVRQKPPPPPTAPPPAPTRPSRPPWSRPASSGTGRRCATAPSREPSGTCRPTRGRW
ncbi:helix-turn-helix transcriptional regulator [Paractinoplanes durhamensis]|uniref:helix-turn-helix transcriptional regulator n=1 Tax=Paractinoplanes durhamensis TaxID=113563 RepID=UPI0036448413